MDSKLAVKKQLDFSPVTIKQEEEEEDITSQLANLSVSLQRQLDSKQDEVSLLRTELLKLRVSYFNKV